MPIYYLDTETTGLYDEDTIVEVAVIDDNDEVVYHSLANPGFPMPAEAQRIHGITDEIVADAPSSEDVIARTLDACRGHEVIIFNASFDCRMVPGLEDAAADVLCCMVRAARHNYGRWPKLGTAAHWAGFEWPSSGAHRALADARACRAVWHWAEKEEARLDEIEAQAIADRVVQGFSYTEPTDEQRWSAREFEIDVAEIQRRRREDAESVFGEPVRRRRELAAAKRREKSELQYQRKIADLHDGTWASFRTLWPKDLCMHVSQIRQEFQFDPRRLDPEMEPCASAIVNGQYHVCGYLWLRSEIEKRAAELSEDERRASLRRPRESAFLAPWETAAGAQA